MAHESFEDGAVAAVLNRSYVCIKVDREERPDIDAVYMAACQMFTGSGGWPLTVLMTPEQKPFWAGTYLPKTEAYGRIGLLELLEAVNHMWESNRKILLSKGEQVTALLNEQQQTPSQAAQPGKAVLIQAVEQYKRSYDTQWGGFGAAPKFPAPHNLLFLLQYAMLEKDDSALQMVRHTLTNLFRGGIFDHLGGGFSRYSTDEKWLVPHFEKMLYDNALLILAYLEAYWMTGDGLFSMVAQRTLAYVMDQLGDQNGGFYCGQDADSDGVEGMYYVFERKEILDVLGEADGAAFCDWFGVTEHGNFQGKNVLNVQNNPHYAEDNARIRSLSQKLYAYRLHRARLHKDDKVLTSWNALMIAALAKAGWLLDAPEYRQAAEKAQSFIQTALTDEIGGLRLRWREGEVAQDGQLDDYAFYAFALLELYKVTYETQYLQQAIRISERMLDCFWDGAQGGFFLYSRYSAPLISRPKETYDGAIPSGNGVAALVLERLFKLTGEAKWQQVSRRQLDFLLGAMQDYPAGHSVALLALIQEASSFELICATAEESVPAELNAFFRSNPIGNLTMLVKTRRNQEALETAAPFTANYPIPEKGTVYYLCHNGACAPPTDRLSALVPRLQGNQ